jgi:hypothetical protein
VSSTTTDPKTVRPEVGPSWAVVSRFTTAVHVGLVIALLLVTTLHVLELHIGVVADVGLVLLTVAASLLVSWPRGGPRT